MPLGCRGKLLDELGHAAVIVPRQAVELIPHVRVQVEREVHQVMALPITPLPSAPLIGMVVPPGHQRDAAGISRYASISSVPARADKVWEADMINQLGDAPPPATTNPVAATPDTSPTNAWNNAVTQAKTGNPQQSVTAIPGIASSPTDAQSSNGWVEHPVTIMQAARDQQLQAEQDCTAPGSIGPLGYNPPLPDNAPHAQALPPGALPATDNQAANRQAFMNWLSGGPYLPPDPHVPDDPDQAANEAEIRSFGGPVPVQYPVDDASGGE
jgi:hypothetical protein